VLLSAQGMDVAAIAKVAFTSEDRVWDMIRNFNTDGSNSLYPRYKGGRAAGNVSAAQRPQVVRKGGSLM
jgi:transposase